MPNSKQIVYLSQSQYAELIANGTITVDGVTVTYDENDIYVTPQAEPVTDVRVAGTSVAANGVANIPLENYWSKTEMKADNNLAGIIINNANYLTTSPANINYIRTGISYGQVIRPDNQHQSVFYGLAKAAGHDEKDNTEFGTYTPEAKAAIQSMLGVSDLIATTENTLVASKAYTVGDVFTANGKLYKVTTALAANDAIVLQNEGETISGANAVETKVGEGFPHDVQVNEVSVVNDGVANVPTANASRFGVIKTSDVYGTTVAANGSGILMISKASDSLIKTGTGSGSANRPIVPQNQHQATFYGLAKAAGDTTQSASSNAVGQYTESAKSAISQMLNGAVSVSGTTPTINALPGIRYVCGEVYTLDITTPERGIVDVVFTSGSTPTVLTVTPPTGMTMQWSNGFDPTALEADTVYEINIMDGCLGVAGAWT